MSKILKIGHRGAKGYENENTLVSFQKAIDLGADGIELDVQLSLDNEIMVIHDETLDRTTDGKGFLNTFSLEKLKSFRTQNGEQIPTLQEVLDAVDQKCFINIELKGKGTAKPVIELIQRYIKEKNWSYNLFLVSSFDWKMLGEVRNLDAMIPIGVLTEESIDHAIAFAKESKAQNIHPCFHLITLENTEQMQKEGFQVFAWTVNELEDIQKMKTFNVNGIITDFPDRL